VRNPAFDVTPAELITAIICEKGIVEAPSRERLQPLMSTSV
jgi:methylthioribose-1-phosphate isomerase